MAIPLPFSEADLLWVLKGYPLRYIRLLLALIGLIGLFIISSATYFSGIFAFNILQGLIIGLLLGGALSTVFTIIVLKRTNHEHRIIFEQSLGIFIIILFSIMFTPIPNPYILFTGFFVYGLIGFSMIWWYERSRSVEVRSRSCLFIEKAWLIEQGLYIPKPIKTVITHEERLAKQPVRVKLSNFHNVWLPTTGDLIVTSCHLVFYPEDQKAPDSPLAKAIPLTDIIDIYQESTHWYSPTFLHVTLEDEKILTFELIGGGKNLLKAIKEQRTKLQ